MGKSFCWKCSTRHNASTGQYCNEKFLEGEEFVESHENAPGDGRTEEVKLCTELGDSVRDLSNRMDNLETLLYKPSEYLSGRTHNVTSEISGSPSSGCTGSRLCHEKASARNGLFDDEDMKNLTFSQERMLTFCMLMNMHENGQGISGFLKKGRFMSEKAATEVYVMDTFVNYNNFVRVLDIRKGAFLTI